MQGHQAESFLSPFVVPREDILPQPVEAPGLQVRPFSGHARLGNAVPGSVVSMAWLSLPPGGSSSLRSHAESSLLIVLQGGATLVGRTARRIERGDIVTLPPTHEYGFRQAAAGGLQALHVIFKVEKLDKVEEITSLEQLLRRNEDRARATMDNPYFRMLKTGALNSEDARGHFRDYARVFCDAFQTFLFTRQAACRDPEYLSTFGEHLREEMGHNDLMKLTGSQRPFDPILEATTSWFCQRMFVLDNAGKAVVHLVLETGGDYFHNLAKPVFATDPSAEYFKTHAEDDARHKEMSVRLLRGHHPHTYRRLHRVLDEAWDMLDALTRRIQQLVERDSSSV